MNKRLFQVDVDYFEIEDYAAQGKIKDVKRFQLTDAVFYSTESNSSLTVETIRFSCAYEINPENDPSFTRFFKSVYENPKDNHLMFERTMTKRIETEEYYAAVSSMVPDKMTSRYRTIFRYRGHKFILDDLDGTTYMTVTNDFMNSTDGEIAETKRGKIFHKLDAISNSIELKISIEDIILAYEETD